MLRIDLGCGKNKQTGFIGMDRYALPEVDVVADMNAGLPFRDDSVDLLFASHSLEHVENLMGTIREVYRICKHGAQISIVAPYSEQKLNQANPYHKCVFNEHTPRFWTDSESTPIDPEDYFHPQSPFWGLSKSDNSDLEIDIRTVRLEYFYFPRYAGLPPAEQRRLRQERTDVCEQIMYHLIVWKGGATDQAKSFDDYLAEFQPYEPPYMPVLRNQGREMALQNSTANAPATEGEALQSKINLEREARAVEAQTAERLRQELTAAKDEANQLRGHAVSLTAEIARLHEHCAAQLEAHSRLSGELHETATYNRILRDEAVNIQRDLEFARTELRRESAAAAASREEVSSLARQNQEFKANLESNDVLRAKLGVTRAELETTATLLGLQRQKEERLNGEADGARREAAAATHGAAAALQETERWKALVHSARRSLRAVAVETCIPGFAEAARVGGFIIGRDTQNQGLPKAFTPLRDYCDRHFHTARSAIAVGGDLTEMPYREYVIPFALDRLTAVSFAIRRLVPETCGVLGVEIVSRSEILAHVRRDLGTDIECDGVAEFCLPTALAGLEKNWSLRIFVRDVEAPVSVYELVRGALFRGTVQSSPLVSFR
jgi:hypothetical protein